MTKKIKSDFFNFKASCNVIFNGVIEIKLTYSHLSSIVFNVDNIAYKKQDWHFMIFALMR